MQEPQYDNLQLVGRQVPDVSVETDASGHKYDVPLPGNYEVGVIVGGVFLPLGVFKAGNVLNPDGSPVNAPAQQTTDSTQQQTETTQTQTQGG